MQDKRWWKKRSTLLDYCSLSKLLDGINRYDEEASAQFIYEADKFYSDFYITSISCLGFIDLHSNKNVNYYELEDKIQNVLSEKFIEEMSLVNPHLIIPCSKEVEKSLKTLKSMGLIKANIGKKLNHPYYCSIKVNTQKEYINYIEMLDKYIS